MGGEQRAGGPATDDYWKDISALLAGDFSRATRSIIVGAALWRATEGPGRSNKYLGCRYWSRGAIDEVAANGLGNLSRRVRHEHVVPRSTVIAQVLALSAPSPDAIKALFDQLAIGCVVTLPEMRRLDLKHRRGMPEGWLTAGPGGAPDVWARYARAGVEPVGPLRWGGRTAFKGPDESPVIDGL